MGGGVGRELWNCYGLRGCPKREWKNTCKMSLNMIEDYYLGGGDGEAWEEVKRNGNRSVCSYCLR